MAGPPASTATEESAHGPQSHDLQGPAADCRHGPQLYADHALTLALQPSETEERLMVRLLAFALNVPADDHQGALQFARGLSDSRRARSLAARAWPASCCTGSRSASPTTGAWPRPAARAGRVSLYCYGSAASIWWAGDREQAHAAAQPRGLAVAGGAGQALAALAQRSMQCSVGAGRPCLDQHRCGVGRPGAAAADGAGGLNAAPMIPGPCPTPADVGSRPADRADHDDDLPPPPPSPRRRPLPLARRSAGRAGAGLGARAQCRGAHACSRPAAFRRDARAACSRCSTRATRSRASRAAAAALYNLWQDASHPRGLWRRTTLAEYRKARPAWETVIDLDALGQAEGENWVWGGAACLGPAYGAAWSALSRGGADARVVREFDIREPAFVKGGFALPEAKSSIDWVDRRHRLVGTDFGPGSLTDSGYPRIVKRWKRGQPLARAATRCSRRSRATWARSSDRPHAGLRAHR